MYFRLTLLKNNDGFLTIDELKELLDPTDFRKSISKSDPEKTNQDSHSKDPDLVWKQLWDEVDENKDGKVEFYLKIALSNLAESSRI